MLALLPTPVQRRAGQNSVLQQVAPIWATAWAQLTGAPVPFQYRHSGGTDTGQAFAGDPFACSTIVSIPTQSPYWAALFPVAFVGTLEEFMHALPRLPQHPYLAYLSDTQATWGGYGERYAISVDALLVIPQPHTREAAAQSVIAHPFIAHLREALATVGGRMEGILELPQFAQRLRSELQLPAELYIYRFKATFTEKIQNGTKYELQV